MPFCCTVPSLPSVSLCTIFSYPMLLPLRASAPYVLTNIRGASLTYLLQWLGYGLDNQQVIRFAVKGDTFLCFPEWPYRLLVPTQPLSIPWVPTAVLAVTRDRARSWPLNSYLVPRLRMSGTILPLPHLPLRRAKGQLYYDFNQYLNPVLSLVWGLFSHNVVPTLILHTSC
jgi:hypothetical protein